MTGVDRDTIPSSIPIMIPPCVMTLEGLISLSDYDPTLGELPDEVKTSFDVGVYQPIWISQNGMYPKLVVRPIQ